MHVDHHHDVWSSPIYILGLQEKVVCVRICVRVPSHSSPPTPTAAHYTIKLFQLLLMSTESYPAIQHLSILSSSFSLISKLDLHEGPRLYIT